MSRQYDHSVFETIELLFSLKEQMRWVKERTCFDLGK